MPESQDAAGDTAPAGSDFLEQDLVRRLAAGPLRWQLNMTLANPGDPLDDASKTWSGAHKVLNAGTLVLQSSQPQADGDCRDINFDPLILPSGIQASNDPCWPHVRPRMPVRTCAGPVKYHRLPHRDG